MADHIRYDLLTQQALRAVVRNVLADVAKKGLPGEHHFYITFDTAAEGVKLSPRLREQFPEEMTIILQHQFWDLTVSDEGFEVGLSFSGVPERVGVPFEAVNAFFDPSVQFGLQFEEVVERQDNKAPANAQKPENKGRASNVPAAAEPQTSTPEKEPSDPEGGGAEVVSLDRFRKK
ncbi:MAG TPA: ClpXP protease specificity-enhancing factor SspB [Pseudolabrys sp.]|nr:ClpXP protease specificity-enhancing factor SspB [Pseudolabrys sp.]